MIQRIIYTLLRIPLWTLFKGLYRVQITGRHHVPRQGAALICCNHISFWDPLLLGLAVPRYLYFMAKEELFEIPGVGAYLRYMNVIPVRRGRPDRRSLETAEKRLQEGHLVGMFPEGTRQRPDRRLGRLRRGAEYLVARTGAPVVPVAILGPYRLFRPLQVRIGPPIPAPPVAGGDEGGRDTERIRSEIMEGISRLLQN